MFCLHKYYTGLILQRSIHDTRMDDLQKKKEENVLCPFQVPHDDIRSVYNIIRDISEYCSLTILISQTDIEQI